MLELLKLKLKKIQELLTKENFKKLVEKVKEERRYLFYIVLWVLGLEFLIILIISISLYFNKSNLEEKSESLLSLSTYNLDYLDLNRYTSKILYGTWKVQDMLEEFDLKKQEREKIGNQFDKLQAPYNNFLKYIYLPSLNIWQDPFTDEIDTTLIWNNFLKKNPYVDTNLLNKWSGFFKNLWDNISYNEITDINIWSIKSEKDYFKIPINVSFNAPDRRSFLMLVNKLSITSNKKNISLINEFSYNLWQSIIKSNKDFFTPSNPAIWTWDEKISQFLWEVFYRSIIEEKNLLEAQTVNNFYTFVVDSWWENYRIVLNKSYVDSIFGVNDSRLWLQISWSHYDSLQKLSRDWTWVNLLWDNGLISRVINDTTKNSLNNSADAVKIKNILFSNRNVVYINIGKNYIISLRLHEKDSSIKLHLDYSSIFSSLVSEDSIAKSIYVSANCDVSSIPAINDSNYVINPSVKSCYFKFRDKFRDIPSLAYVIWVPWGNKLEKLVDFYSWLPPILNVTRFVFKETDKRLADESKWKFQWDIAIELYWKNVTNDEISNIQKNLWTICFAWALDKKDFILTPDSVLNLINKEITSVSGKDNIDSTIIWNLVEMQTILSAIKKDYINFDNYNKIVKVFEIYRIITENDWWICKK